MPIKKESPYLAVYEIVLKIPRGKVLTYGLISDMLDGRLSAQGVGWALKALGSESFRTNPAYEKYRKRTVPWQRVVARNGGMSTVKLGIMPPNHQMNLLQKEGVEFNDEGCVVMSKHLWLKHRT